MQASEQAAVVIRQAVFSDAQAIFSLIQQNTDMLVPRSISNIVQNMDRFLVAELAGELIGCIAYEFLPEIGNTKRTSVELQSVCVAKAWRNHGVGERLVRQQIERLLLLKPYQLIVLTFAEKFFLGLGFRPIPKETIMHKLYRGCINCTKHESPFTCPEIAMAFSLEAEQR